MNKKLEQICLRYASTEVVYATLKKKSGALVGVY
jgi:hypothetical protein